MTRLVRTTPVDNGVPGTPALAQPTPTGPTWLPDSKLEALMAQERLTWTTQTVDLSRVRFKDTTFQTRFGSQTTDDRHVADLKELMLAPDAVFLMCLLYEHGGIYVIVCGRHRLLAAVATGLKEVTAYVLTGTEVAPSAVRRVSARSNFAQLGETAKDRMEGALQSLLGIEGALKGEVKAEQRRQVATFWEVSEHTLRSVYQAAVVDHALTELGIRGHLDQKPKKYLWTAFRERPGLFAHLARYALMVDYDRFHSVYNEVVRLPESDALARLNGLLAPGRGGSRSPDDHLADGSKPVGVTKRVHVRKRPVLGIISKLADINAYLTNVASLTVLDASAEEVVQASDLCSEVIKHLLRIKKVR